MSLDFSDQVLCFQSELKPYITLFFLHVIGWLFIQSVFYLHTKKKRQDIYRSALQLPVSLLLEFRDDDSSIIRNAVQRQLNENRFGQTNALIQQNQKVELQTTGYFVRVKCETPASITVCASKRDMLHKHRPNKGDLQDTAKDQTRNTKTGRSLYTESESNLLLRVKRLGARQRDLLRRLQELSVDFFDSEMIGAQAKETARAPDSTNRLHRTKLESMSSSSDVGALGILPEWDTRSKLPSLQPISGLPEAQLGP